MWASGRAEQRLAVRCHAQGRHGDVAIVSTTGHSRGGGSSKRFGPVGLRAMKPARSPTPPKASIHSRDLLLGMLHLTRALGLGWQGVFGAGMASLDLDRFIGALGSRPRRSSP